MTRYSEVSYTYSGGSKVFTIPFSYLKTEHINVFIDDVEATDFEFNTASQIQVNDEITSGQVVKIVRTTPIDSRMVNFNDRSVLNAQQQNLDSNQLFNVVQEVYDRNGNFTEDIQTQVDTANTNASAAVSTANTANSKADTAVSTANAAETKADNAVSTANSASSVANTASTNATNAVNTANSASSTATAASNKVDEFAEDIETVIEAAEDIEQFHEAINTCNQKATQATTAATNANTYATTASQKVTEITNLITDFNNQKGQINGIAPLDANAKLPIIHIPTGVELTANKDVANGYCGLDDAALIPLTHIPEIYADRELNNLSDFGNARLQFNPFQINNGTVNADGLNATLYKSTDTTLTCDPCTITTADGRTKEFTSTANYVVSSTPITKDVTWVQPVLSSNGTMGGSSFAVQATAHSGTNDAWKAFDNNNSTMYEVGNGQSPHLYMYNPKPLKVTAISVSSSSYPLRQFEVRASNDFSNWVVLTSGTASGNSYTISLSNNNNYYKYYDLHQTSSEGKNIQTIRLTAKYQETVSDADGTYYVLKNFEDGSLSLCKKLYYTDIENPASLTTGDYWLYTNKAPWSFKTYDGTDWQNANNMVAIGKVKIASGVITSVTNYKFNVAAWSSLWHTYGISKSASWFLPAVVVENYVNGKSWYRVWSDGWIEQGGYLSVTSSSATVNLLKSHANTNYNITLGSYQPTVGAGYAVVISSTKNSFVLDCNGLGSLSMWWQTAGY